jgi:hypothetical protein
MKKALTKTGQRLFHVWRRGAWYLTKYETLFNICIDIYIRRSAMTSVLKSIRFNLDDEEDRKLYEWLSHLKRGEFTEQTKEFWIAKMKESEKDGSI